MVVLFFYTAPLLDRLVQIVFYGEVFDVDMMCYCFYDEVLDVDITCYCFYDEVLDVDIMCYCLLFLRRSV